MNCEEAEANLSLYVAGDIERHGARERIALHLEGCDSCRARAGEWEASRRLLQLQQPPEFDAAFFDSVRRGVMRQISEPRPSLLARLLGQPFGQRTLTYAAALSLLVCAFVLSSHFLRRAPSPVVGVSQGKNAGPAEEASGVAQETVKRARGNGAANVSRLGEPASSVKPLVALSHRHRVRQARDAAQVTAPRMKVVRASREPEERQAAEARRVPGVIPPGAEPKSAGASNPVETVASAEREMLRIELQTADPNIRIIWLSPRTTDSASSGKANR